MLMRLFLLLLHYPPYLFLFLFDLIGVVVLSLAKFGVMTEHFIKPMVLRRIFIFIYLPISLFLYFLTIPVCCFFLTIFMPHEYYEKTMYSKMFDDENKWGR